MKQHFQRGQASTELEIYKVERLALNNAYLATTVWYLSNNIKVETHLVPCWPQELPVEHTEAVKIHEFN